MNVWLNQTENIQAELPQISDFHNKIIMGKIMNDKLYYGDIYENFETWNLCIVYSHNNTIKRKGDRLVPCIVSNIFKELSSIMQIWFEISHPVCNNIRKM